MKNNIIGFFCLCFLLVGCHQADEMDFVNEDLRMSVVASIKGSDNLVTSRYGGDTPNSVSFVDGDEIGMSVNGRAFVKWTKDANGDGWSPDGNAVFWDDKTSDHSFVAFYPYDSNVTIERIPMPDLSGQLGTMESIAEKDFLMAQKTQTYGTNGVVEFKPFNESVDYSFKHVSSLVVVTLKGEGELASATINKISINGTNLFTPSNCVKIDGGFTVDIDETKQQDLLELSLSHQMESKNKTYYFIVNSGTVSLSAVTLSISYTTAQGGYIAKLNGLGTTEVKTFEKGKKYSYSLSVAGGELVISGNEIQDWGEGLNLGDIVINGIEQGESNEGNDENQ
jgi:hypothetical protein